MRVSQEAFVRPNEKRELLEIIEQYRRGHLPLIVSPAPTQPLCAEIRSALFERTVLSKAGIQSSCSSEITLEGRRPRACCGCGLQ